MYNDICQLNAEFNPDLTWLWYNSYIDLSYFFVIVISSYKLIHRKWVLFLFTSIQHIEDGTKCLKYYRRHIQVYFRGRKSSYFVWNLTECSPGSKWQWLNICSGNGVAPSRQHTITVANHDNVHRRHHYSDVIMSAITSQITGIWTVCSDVCSSAHQRNHQSYASLAFARGIPPWFPLAKGQ